MRALRRPGTLALLAAACLPALFAGAACADNGPHMKEQGLTPDSCAGCHRAHTAKAPYLLKESEESLCYTCHGSAAGGSDLDVADGVGYAGAESGGAGRVGPALALRGGGFKYALIDSGDPSGNGYLGEIPVLTQGRAVTSSHSTNSSMQMAWGNGPISASINYGKMVSLRCGSCHDPHGNGMYRILRPIPEESGAGEAQKVEIPDATQKLYTTENYWLVEDEYDPQFVEKISEWCALCHTRYLAGHNSAIISSGDAVYDYRHRTNETSQGTPTCIQCHLAHGTDATMGENSSRVPLPNGEPAARSSEVGGGGGDSYLLRINNWGVCVMCHNNL